MTREDITSMAREAGFVGFDGDNGSLRRFAALAYAFGATAEREACAKVCEDISKKSVGAGWPYGSVADDCAAVIRARGQA